MRISKNESSRPCAICGRRLLMGEQFTRFSPGGDDELVEVCRLCFEKAIDHGWPEVYAPAAWRWVMCVIRKLPRWVMRKIKF